MSDESLAEKSAVPSLTKARQIFLYIAPFPALAFFKIWASFGRDPLSLLTVACAMLIYCVFILALASRWDKPTYFDWTVSAYFLVIAASLALWPEAAGGILTNFAVTGIYLCMFAAAFFPPVLGFDPFTYHYAKKSAPEMVWGTSAFISINRIMTFIWAGIFAVCIILSLYPSVVTRALIPLTLILGVGIPFNARFPDFYLKRVGLPTIAEMIKLRDAAASDAAFPLESGAIPHAPDESPRSTALGPSREPTTGQAVPLGRSQTLKEATMKVIAINSSPRGEGTSKTGIMLDALVKGMVDAGAEVETVNLRQKKVRNCIGCYTCWTKTPGICVHKDDMTNELFPKWIEADMAIYASPLYHFTLNATMKAFIERTLPMLEPFLVKGDEKTTHPIRHKPPKAAVLSVAGFPEPSVFEQLSSYVNFLFRKGLVAEIYRPGAEVLTLPELSEKAGDILEATAQAGRELVQSMKVSQATMERISQPMGGDFDTFCKMANLFWKSCIKEGVTPAEFQQMNLVPRPDSIEGFMMVMSRGFNPGNAAGIRAILQFNFSGEVDGSCFFKIENGRIESREGSAEKPELTLETPFEVWMDIMTGKAEGQQMFMEQKYKAIGDLSLLMRMKDLFGKAKK